MIKRFIDQDNALTFKEKKEELKDIIDVIARKYLLYIVGNNLENFKEKFVPEIVNYAEKYSNYKPKYLLFTGQYLGSFIRSALLSKNTISIGFNTISNDVDIFVPLYGLYTYKSTHNIEISDNIQVVNHYDSIDVINKYDIVSTEYYRSDFVNNKVNVTLVSHPILSKFSKNKDVNESKLILLCREIIDKFDINSVKVGVVYNIDEKRIVDVIIHEDYLNFIISGYLQITPTTDYFKGFPRIIKKIKEFNDRHIRTVEQLDYFIKNNKFISENNKVVKLPKESETTVEFYSKSTLESIASIDMNLKVNYPNYSEIFKYYDYLIALYKYIINKPLDDHQTIASKGVKVPNPLSIGVLRNKKLISLFEKGFGTFLEKNGFQIDVVKKEDDFDKLTIYFSLSIDKKDIDYISIVEESFILNEYADLFLKKFVEVGTVPGISEFKLVAKLQVLYEKRSKKKIKRIYDYLLSILNTKSYALLALGEIIKYNLVNIPLGDLKILKTIENHREIDIFFMNLLKLYRFDKALKIVNYVETLKKEVIRKRVKDKKEQELIELEIINSLYSATNLLNVDLHVKILMNNDLELIREPLEKTIDKLIQEQLKLKNEVIIPQEFNPIKVKKGGYVIEELKTAFDLRYEGSIMSHCVGGYVDNVKRYRSSIFRLESKEDKTFRYTCEINPGTYGIIQVRGKHNRSVDNNHKEIVDELIERVVDEMKKQKRREIVEEKKNQGAESIQPPRPAQPINIDLHPQIPHPAQEQVDDYLF